MSSEQATTSLVEVTDADFDWMEGGEPARGCELRLPPGGVDDPQVLRIVRGIVKKLHAQDSRAAWMIVSDGEVVGLCSYRSAPTEGEVEIGYGVAASRRNRGHATRAVAAIMKAAKADPAVRVVVAETAVDNPASQRALERNDFERIGTRSDPEDGEVIRWRKVL